MTFIDRQRSSLMLKNYWILEDERGHMKGRQLVPLKPLSILSKIGHLFKSNHTGM